MVEGCIAPDEIQEGDLVAYIEGTALDRVAGHIARCPACAAEIKELRLTDSLLRQVFSLVNESPVGQELVGPHDLQPQVRKSSQPATTRHRNQNWLPRPRQVSWRPIIQNVALGLIVIFLLSTLPAGIYLYNQLQINTSAEIVREGVATVVVTVEETAEIIKEVATKVAQTTEQPLPETQLIDALSPGQVIIEEMIEIVPPRSLRQMIEREFQGQTDNLSAYSPPAAETVTDDRQLVMDADGETYAVWTARQNGRTTMYFVRSADSGETWSDNIEITEGYEKVFSPGLAVDTENNHLYVVWRSGYNAAANIYLARSENNGQTWSRRMRIREATGRIITKPSLAVDSGGSLYVTWQNRDRSNIKIYFIQSSDGGQTWSDRVLVASIGG